MGWGTPANFNRFRVLAALLHGTLVVGISQTLRRWTEGATYVRQGDHHVGHWPTFLVFLIYITRSSLLVIKSLGTIHHHRHHHEVYFRQKSIETIIKKKETHTHAHTHTRTHTHAHTHKIQYLCIKIYTYTRNTNAKKVKKNYRDAWLQYFLIRNNDSQIIHDCCE